MPKSAKKALQGTMKQLKHEHPTLEDRLIRYRERRDSYDAKRISGQRAPTSVKHGRPVRHAYRDPSG